jgi:plastocyanin
MRIRGVAAALFLTLAALSFAACGDDDGSETTTTTTTTEEAGGAAGGESEANAPATSGDAVRSAKVEIISFAYEPDPVRIEAGGKVIWQNMDSAPHTATADDRSFSTGTLAEGKLKSESFKTAGTFTYFCEIHPDMKGTVEVVEG